MAGKHSHWAPSSLDAVALCPGRWNATRFLPEEESIFSETGSFGHHIAERCFNEFKPAEFFIGSIHTAIIKRRAHEIEFTPRLAHAVQRYLDWCWEVPGDMFVERKVNITPWTTSIDEEFGTLDNAIFDPDTGTLTVTDLKLGEGVKVYAKGKLQLIQYALAILREFEAFYTVKRVALRICQPLLDHFDVWEIDVAELQRWGGVIKQVWLKADRPDAPFHAHKDACTFCRVAHRCRELDRATSEEALLQVSEADREFIDDPIYMASDEELVAAWLLKPLINLRMKAIDTHLRTVVAAKGHGVLGLKFVEGRSNRVWRSEADAREQMTAVGIPEAQQHKYELISPSDAEAIARGKENKKILAQAISKPPGKPTLAPLDDPRKEYGADVIESVFEYAEAEGEEEELY